MRFVNNGLVFHIVACGRVPLANNLTIKRFYHNFVLAIHLLYPNLFALCCNNALDKQSVLVICAIHLGEKVEMTL